MVSITQEIVDRVMSRKLSFNDPCVICGVQSKKCPHSMTETQEVVDYVHAQAQRARRMGREH